MENFILCEGISDKEFLKQLIKKIGYPDKAIFVKNMKGKPKITHAEQTVVDNYTEDNVLIIVDADNDNVIALRETIKAKWNITDDRIFIMPNNQNEGCLETLMLNFYKKANFLQPLIIYLKEKNCDDKAIVAACRFCYKELPGIQFNNFGDPLFDSLKATIQQNFPLLNP
ncbi:MAG: hypothetical protein FWE37_01660 [Spirochaetaceae bacterium]|nr:hypothetical protein [Spirochaetaceae bacterium]